MFDDEQPGKFVADVIRERHPGRGIDPAIDLFLEVIVRGQGEGDQRTDPQNLPEDRPRSPGQIDASVVDGELVAEPGLQERRVRYPRSGTGEPNTSDVALTQHGL